ncbi:MAG: YaeQ family protein [Pseudomonadota bacterium]
MALKPIIYKPTVQLANSDVAYYDNLSLTLARHPSETLERMTVRLLAYCLLVQPGLEFGKGLSTTDEPDLWLHNDNGVIEHWIDVGQIEPTRLKKACGRAKNVSVCCFGKSADTWWRLNKDAVIVLPNITVWHYPFSEVVSVAALIDRKVKLSVSIVGGVVYADNGSESASLEPRRFFTTG